MKERTKRNLGNIFGSLISNQRAIDGAKENPWWAAIIFALVGTFVPVIPVMVTTANANGGSFMDGLTYDQEYGVTDTSIQFLKDGYEFKLEDLKLKAYVNGAPVSTLENGYVERIYTREYTNNPITGAVLEAPVRVAELRTIYVDGDAEKAADVLTQLRLRNYKLLDNFNETVYTLTSDIDEEINYYIPSMLCFYQDGLVYNINKIGTVNTVISSYSGCNWNKSELPDGLLHAILTDELSNSEFVNNYVDYKTSVSGDKHEAVKASYKNLRNIFAEGFLEAKDRQLLISTLLYFGIYLLLTFIMGLMIFILTRGKNNIFNYMKFWPCMKIAMWASLAPGILSMILSFIMPQFASMSFVMLMGVRTMWMCMKQFRPQ